MCLRAPRLCCSLVLRTHYQQLHVVHISRTCTVYIVSILPWNSSNKAVENTVWIRHCCCTENLVWRICRYRFSTMTSSHEVQRSIYQTYQNSLSYTKGMHTSVQVPKEGRANGAHDPSVVHLMSAKLKYKHLKYVKCLILQILYIMYFIHMKQNKG